MKAITPQDIDNIATSLQELNCYIQKATLEASTLYNDELLVLKQELSREVQKELQEVYSVIKDSIEPTVQSATNKLSTYTKLLNVPTKPEALPSYLVDVATAMFGPPQKELIELLANYVEPIARLTAEVQRASTITLPSVSSSNILSTDI